MENLENKTNEKREKTQQQLLHEYFERHAEYFGEKPGEDPAEAVKRGITLPPLPSAQPRATTTTRKPSKPAGDYFTPDYFKKS